MNNSITIRATYRDLGYRENYQEFNWYVVRLRARKVLRNGIIVKEGTESVAMSQNGFEWLITEKQAVELIDKYNRKNADYAYVPMSEVDFE